MTTKITLIYDNPITPSAFESTFTEGQVALAKRVPELDGIEVSKVWPKEDGSVTPKYRMLDLYFSDYAAASRAVETREASALFQAAAAGATGGLTILFSDIEQSQSRSADGAPA